MDSNTSRLDRLDERERTEWFIKLRLGGFPDGLLRVIAELPEDRRERIIRLWYSAAIAEMDAESTIQESAEVVEATS